MSSDTRETPARGNDPNKGLNVKTFAISVGAFLVLALLSVLLFAVWTAKTGRPVTSPATPVGGGTKVPQKGK